MAARRPVTIESLTAKLNYANKKTKFAWAKYYETIRSEIEAAHTHYNVITRTVTDDSIPEHIKGELRTMSAELRKKWECPICMEFIETEALEITNCGHFYCKTCLDGVKAHAREHSEEKWSCAVCRRKHCFKDDE